MNTFYISNLALVALCRSTRASSSAASSGRITIAAIYIITWEIQVAVVAVGAQLQNDGNWLSSVDDTAHRRL